MHEQFEIIVKMEVVGEESKRFEMTFKNPVVYGFIQFFRLSLFLSL